MENNKVIPTNKAGRAAVVTAMETAGFAALRSGLGVIPGKYTFSTPDNENIYGVKPVQSAKGKFGLTLVAGTLKGAEDKNKAVNNTYGLGDTDKQFVVTLDQFQAIEPNQVYDVVVGENGRISSLVLASTEVLAEA